MGQKVSHVESQSVGRGRLGLRRLLLDGVAGASLFMATVTSAATGHEMADRDVAFSSALIQPLDFPVVPGIADEASSVDSSIASLEARYAAYSNETLTALTASWDALDVHQRRALLTEVRQRMARSGARTIQIRTARRYGRLIRQPDGRVIRIEARVVQVTPVTLGQTRGPAGAGFGVGFEHRSTGTSLPLSGALPPAVLPQGVDAMPVGVDLRQDDAATVSDPATPRLR